MNRYIILPQVKSTNSWLKEHAAELPGGTLVSTPEQTAGRGQRGNCWEAAPGENITMSLLLKGLNLHPAQQFLISEAVALGAVRLLDGIEDLGDEVSIKWPNDIYVGNRKIAGILIEHSIGQTEDGAKLLHTVAGIGLNVNQREFLSDAPNPVSLAQLTGRLFPVEELTRLLGEAIMREVAPFATADGSLSECNDYARELHQRFKSRLWRREGLHPFALPGGERFHASISDVTPDGMLHLNTPEGNIRTFAFKEVAFLL